MPREQATSLTTVSVSPTFVGSVGRSSPRTLAEAHREVRYAAVELVKDSRYRAYQTPDRLPLYRRLIIAGI